MTLHNQDQLRASMVILRTPINDSRAYRLHQLSMSLQRASLWLSTPGRPYGDPEVGSYFEDWVKEIITLLRAKNYHIEDLPTSLDPTYDARTYSLDSQVIFDFVELYSFPETNPRQESGSTSDRRLGPPIYNCYRDVKRQEEEVHPLAAPIGHRYAPSDMIAVMPSWGGAQTTSSSVLLRGSNSIFSQQMQDEGNEFRPARSDAISRDRLAGFRGRHE
ncbi:hypothetical protein M231_07675 [Tremella mesenterica]|uniref:Uncharacterized protein n=1 Tax=Tremella mesenterica TaxID=5217 RepID=A0A4Q1BDS9_TREME|nr:hypothetical protein M231_07675 [Tremella mesenterica]